MREPSLVLLACGGYRSGSTLLYNLLGEHAERSLAGRRVGYVEPDQVDLLAGPAWSFVAAIGVAVAKAHHTPAVPGGGRWDRLLDDGRLLPVCTLRDWHDVLHSFCRAFGQAPAEVLASRRWQVNLSNVRWWVARGARVVAYDDLVDAPLEVVASTWAGTGLPVDAAAARGAVRAAALPAACGDGPLGPEADRRNLLHAGHVTTPRGGGWRAWPEDVLRDVEVALRPLQEEFGGALQVSRSGTAG